MMNNFKNWYIRNQYAITWFIIGWLTMSCFNHLARGQYVWAMFDAVLAYINYQLGKM